MSKKIDINSIPKSELVLVGNDGRMSDKKFEDKPIGYFRDAWRRFCKNRASVAAACIIIIIVLFAFIAPLVNTRYDASFIDPQYKSKAPWSQTLSNIGIADGGTTRDFSEIGLIKTVAIGIAAADKNGTGKISLADGLANEFQPMIKIGDPVTYLDPAKNEKKNYNSRVNVYLEVGFVYKDVEQAEYAKILAWQEKTGIQVLYPLVSDYNETQYTPDANIWYKVNNYQRKAAVDESGRIISYSDNMTLVDNYLRDENGNARYWAYTGGGNAETAQYKVRVLYYNYYRYVNGFEPDYLFGTDSAGYDLCLRLAGGIKLSLLVAICVSLINFVIGAIYGAIEGYYGGACDMVLERVSDILSGVPFIVVATLFQIHLAAKVGAVPSLLFAFVATGWIGTAARVRTQFYRFKNQEYVMAARTLGASDSRIIWKHIFPNSLGTIITSCALVIPGVIGSESMLSYLGIVKLGSAEVTSLGTLLSDANGIWTNYPHLMFFPALVLSLLMICFNLFGNGLRDAFNPSLRGVED